MIDRVPHMRLHRLHSRCAEVVSTYLQVLQRGPHRVRRNVREQTRYHLVNRTHKEHTDCG